MEWLRSLWRDDTKRSRLVVRMAATTHTGKVREANEDNFFFDGRYMSRDHQSLDEIYTAEKVVSDGTIVALFDGMGGETAGELASYTAARNLADIEKQKEISDQPEELVRMLNREVCAQGKVEKISQMGSTAIICRFGGEEKEKSSWIANLGDSPAYVFSNGELTLLTHAHTNAEFLQKCGITNRKPGLTQFLGISEEEFQIEPYVRYFSPQNQEQYLMCSDGLTDMVAEDEIRKILSERIPVKEKVQNLLTLALDKGGRDNITMILCEIWEGIE